MRDILSIKNDIVSFADAAKNGLLKPKDIDRFIAIITSLENIEDKIAVLRFVHRYSNRGGIVVPQIEKLLSEYYFEYSELEKSIVKKLQYLSWSNRYINIHTSNIRLESEAFEIFCTVTAQEDLLGFIQEFDGYYNIDLHENTINLNMADVKKVWRLNQKVKIKTINKSPQNSNLYSFNCISESGYHLWGITHNGDKPFNDDNITYIELDNGEIIIAIADGSGNSTNANVSSYLAIEYFMFAYINSLNYDLSIRFASSALRNYNLQTRLDGETTLVLFKINKMWEGDIVSIGDSPYIVQRTEKEYICSDLRPSGRWILGGEPIGHTITSSGNVLWNVDMKEELPKISTDKIEELLLFSDGIVLSDENDFSSIIEIVEKKEKYEIADTILNRALNSFRRNQTTPDNVSIIYGTKE
jgi:hypothetical protein